ncbi:MAG: 4Fe-4S dicluster domain-containing protein [Chloroflexi bacterium]|nr:4Fe-4S dicluster domain-containing protein [Chloroflexota bacterium]
MQHTINISQIGVRGEAMVRAIQSCVHCGFCLAVCPTYRVLGQEMDSPRGRIYLMKGVLEGVLQPEEAQLHIDRCLGCVACMPACPSGVDYGGLLMGYRAKVEAGRKRPLLDTAARRLICETLPYPARFRLAVRTGKMAKLLQNSLPDQLSVMIGLLPTQLSKSEPLPELIPAKGKRRARIALLTGCVQQVLAPEISWATVHVLAANGVEVVVPEGQGCCGSILSHIGADQQAKSLAHNNLNVFPDDVDAIITNAAGCGSGMKEYGLLFAGTQAESEARAFAAMVQDVTTFLHELGALPMQPLPQPLTVAYHDACHLRHAQGIMDAPRQLLQAIPNVTLVELGDDGLCCGSAGTYNLEQPEIAAELGRRKATAILNTGADVVATGNIGCMTQIQTHLGVERPLPIYHTIQLLAMGYRNEREIIS